MRPSTPRLCASLVLLASAALGPGAWAEAQRPDGSTPPVAQSGSPTTSPAQPEAAAPPKPAAPAPTPAAKPAAPTAAAKTPGTAATVAPLKTIEGIMGKAVRSRSGEDMGHIVDVLVDGSGDLRAAVIDFGGFLGVGSRKVAVAWKTLDFTDSIQSGSVKVSLTRDQIRQAPEYKPDEPIVILEGTAPAKPEPPEPAKREPAAPAKPAPAASSPGHNQDSPPR